MRAMWTAAAGMSTQQAAVDVTANNVANANTPGFKRAVAAVIELAREEARPATSEFPALEVGTGSGALATLSVVTQGPLVETGVPTHLALEGDGFFVLEGPQGPVYTRAGQFRISPDGYLVSMHGWRVRGAGAIPREAVGLAVGRDGRVLAVMPDGTQREVGRIVLARFRAPSALASAGDGCYRESPASGPPEEVRPGERGAGVVLQGFLERSNVDLAQEMVSLIAAQRVYEVCAKVIQVGDEMLATANSIKR
ncbi:flagellar basal-body rod protein FlgG [Thermanaeromonas toyohensis ToBE]|uniref:Flagellar basal-body rod protein FlgG n=1 Tax=Thermanaeromonas toyohensis ToBE TaxID=698762 RepID=A0A1W1VTA7_9FIRM|nr:flagellar hook-basal body protein [Thermanaeromonas toyohensis]SMB96602.1 flagellar basal-body rod protein FlgG [Thermanaeromonas toyohensis ToBE]